MTKFVYDFLHRKVETWVGTSESNLTRTELSAYDADGNLITQTLYTDATSGRVTHYVYAPQQGGRLIKKTYDGSAEIDTFDYDWQGNLTEVAKYVTDETVPGNVRALTKHFYDSRGNRYATNVYGVVVSNGVGQYDEEKSVSENSWRSQSGQLLKTQSNNGLILKYQYDGAGRLIYEFASGDITETITPTYEQALNVAGDVVTTQKEYIYDESSNTIVVNYLDRIPGFDVTNTGPLTDGVSPEIARVSSIAYWYDGENRRTKTANYGRNGNNLRLTSQPTEPTGSGSEVLVTSTSYAYNVDGAAEAVTVSDPMGKFTVMRYDVFGRIYQKIENKKGNRSPA